MAVIKNFFKTLFSVFVEIKKEQANQHVRFHNKGFFHNWE